MGDRSPSRSRSLSYSEASGRASSSSRSISGRGEMVVSQASPEANTTVNRAARYHDSASAKNGGDRHNAGQHYRPHHSFSPTRSPSRSPTRHGEYLGRRRRQRDIDHYGQDYPRSRRRRIQHADSWARPHEVARDRSRSPWRANQSGREHGTANGRNGNTNDRTAGPSSVTKFGERSARTVHSPERQSAATAPRAPQVGVGESRKGGSADGQVHAETLELHTNVASTQIDPPSRSVTTRDEPKSTSKLSDAEIIEQRRKKREAIKAKHQKGAPLLVQALEQSVPSAGMADVHLDPGADSSVQSPPSTAQSPSTPQDVSSPGSPASLAFGSVDELVNIRQLGDVDNVEGPSAADYDPNMDMDEDRPDHKRQNGLDSKPHDAPNGVAAPEPPAVSGQAKEADMFAEDDDDFDMFAEEDRPMARSTRARALDENLLDNWDYPDGHYRIIPAELLDARYTVTGQIGKGTFATVVEANDTVTNQKVAIKIARSNETMYKAGMKEIGFLELLNEKDQEDHKHVIRLLRYFNHKNHLCLVFEHLSNDLREVLKKFGRNVGLSLQAIKAFAHQTFLALAHLKSCSVLHADLKPDNILVDERNTLLKICDLGTATFQRDAEITPYLVSRFYRAPEIILGIKFDYSIDMWSIGCTLFELYTGRILFPGGNNNNMLRVIQESRGKFPNRVIKRASLADQYFDENFVFYSQEREKITDKIVQRPLHFTKVEPGKDIRARVFAGSSNMSQAELKELTVFVDLLDKCLQLDPERRITPKDALKHPFIQRPERLAPSANAPSLKSKLAPAHPARTLK